jgi:hypothetical protein
MLLAPFTMSMSMSGRPFADSPATAPPEPPPIAASLSAGSLRAAPWACPSARGMRSSTPPPLSFIRTRKGRNGVYLITVSEQGSAWIR